MQTSSADSPLGRKNPFSLYWALSRTPHKMLDMTAPAFSVLWYLSAFPPVRIICLGLITAFAGYTAVYALNDLIDFRTDRAKIAYTDTGGDYLDAMMVRHPLAQGLLSVRQGIMWAGGWSLVALVGAWLLHPMCLVVFLSGALLEIVYCLLWRVSPWRSVISGFVKNSGPVAALFAVDPHPSPLLAALLFAGFFFWEIGGQNIPADWTDVDVDRRFKAQTIPVRLGSRRAAVLMIVSLMLAVFSCALLFFVRFSAGPLAGSISILVVGSLMLLVPGYRLYSTRRHQDAVRLFNRASYFPLVLLIVTLSGILITS